MKIVFNLLNRRNKASYGICYGIFWFIHFQSAFAELKWDSQSVDVIAKPTDTTVFSYFDFINAGETEIRISKISTSCGCTTAEASKQLFLPGDKGQIGIAYKVGDETGLRKATVNVEMEGAASKAVVLTMNVSIPSLVKFSASRLSWKAGESPTVKVVEAEITTTVPLHFLKASSADQRLMVKLDTTSAAGRYRIQIQPKSTEEIIRAAVTLESDYPKEKPRRFSIYVWVR